METAIIVLWWIGLAGALVWTLLLLKQVALLLRVLSSILDLARSIRHASRGIAANMANVAPLARLEAPARALGKVAARAGLLETEAEAEAS
jgi:hypothetical protein